MRSAILLLVLGFPPAGQPVATLPAPPPAVAATGRDEQVLTAARQAVPPDGLLDFVRKRSQPLPDPAEVSRLVAQLGDASAPVADQAAGPLVALGPAVLPALRQAS